MYSPETGNTEDGMAARAPDVMASATRAEGRTQGWWRAGQLENICWGRGQDPGLSWTAPAAAWGWPGGKEFLVKRDLQWSLLRDYVHASFSYIVFIVKQAVTVGLIWAS